MTLYSLKKNSTGEWHIFECQKNGKELCTCNTPHSICRKMTIPNDNISCFKSDGHSCLEEQTAREKCAKMERKVCGICVSHLYGAFKEE